MNAPLSRAEQREATIRELIPAHATTIRQSVESGGPELALIADGVTDCLSQDAIAQQVVRISLMSAAAAGAYIALLAKVVIDQQAELEATKEVAQMERNRQDSHAEGCIARGFWSAQ